MADLLQGLLALLLAGGVMGGIGYMIWRDRRPEAGTRRTVAGAYVITRCGYEKGRLITSDYDFDVAERPRFYVTLQLPDGTRGEFETVKEVYFNAGEGMTGEAELKGRWLGRFLPYVGTRP